METLLKQARTAQGATTRPAEVFSFTHNSPTVSVVIPALNEADNLPFVLPKIPSWVYEVLVVDGHSTDGTLEATCSLYPNARRVQQVGRGKGAALRSGFAAATGDIIVMMDADGSMEPGEISAFYGALLAGADFAKGSRFAQGGGTTDMPFYRQLGNLGFVWLVRVFFGGRYSDLLYGYNAFWRRTLPQLKLDANGFEIETMMNIRALREGLKVAEVPSFEAPRVVGVGRLRTFPDGWRVLKTIFKERFPFLNRRAAQAVDEASPEKPFEELPGCNISDLTGTPRGSDRGAL
jgi:glycosyltransferase involved in cell wall biosynthesis